MNTPNLDRLLKEIGEKGEIKQVIYDNNYNYYGYFIVYWSHSAYPLSDILIKNIDKIFDVAFHNLEYMKPLNWFKLDLFKAIREDKLEEWAWTLFSTSSSTSSQSF